jgi:hypothetical protein
MPPASVMGGAATAASGPAGSVRLRLLTAGGNWTRVGLIVGRATRRARVRFGTRVCRVRSTNAPRRANCIGNESPGAGTRDALPGDERTAGGARL